MEVRVDVDVAVVVGSSDGDWVEEVVVVITVMVEVGETASDVVVELGRAEADGI